MTEKWVQVAETGDIDDDDAIAVEAGGRKIALYFVEGSYYATDDLCTHEQASLAEGYIDGLTIECPLHQGVFCLKSGKALHPPAEKDVAVFPVKVEGSKIFVQID